MKRVGIITWHNNHNCGGSLQSYALCTVLNQISNINAEIINYNSRKGKEYGLIERIVKITIARLIEKSNINGQSKYCRPFLIFERDYLKMGDEIPSKDELKHASEQYDTIICGSDQIWAPNVFDPVYMLDFATRDVKKISYAASIGLNYIPDNLCQKYKSLLSDFSNISVRETTGKELLARRCGIEAKVVLDPTFLLTMDYYAKLENEIKPLNKYDFVFCYFLNENNNYRTIVSDFANNQNLKVVGLSRNHEDSQWMFPFNNIGPKEFLWLIHHAKYVFTDSYHGTIFSMLYHKPFYTFERFSSDSPINQNSRLYQLDRWFDISKRVVTETHSIEMCEEFNYIKFENDLEKARKISIDFLKEALS